ncbi:MAG: cell wall hydrolase, partial [Lachnospiraceae bacterium]|nr:cell wall hydrolase [Lachnospiraceae bacterium]
SFFTADPYDVNVTVLKKTIQPTERATELDQTYVVTTLSESENYIEPSDDEDGYQAIDTLTVKTISDSFDPYASSSESIDAYEEEDPDVSGDTSNEDTEAYEVRGLGDIFKSVTQDQIPLLETGALPGTYSIQTGAYVTLDEYLSLCKIVEAEAGCEDTEGRRLVANVIINRVNSDIFADNIADAILEDGQFAPVARGGFKKAVPTYDTKQAVMTALNGIDNSQGALYFQKSPTKHWGTKKYLFRYGSHSFYK